MEQVTRFGDFQTTRHVAFGIFTFSATVFVSYLMKTKYIGISVVSSLIVVEIISRLAISMIWGTSAFKPADIHLHFYPELEKLDRFEYDDSRSNLLILAGSVLSNDTISFEYKGEIVHTHFCALGEVLDKDRFQVINLAQPAHNSLDSWYKYRYISQRFDWVLFYHGINDTRTNNIETERFDPWYRHVEFYDDLYILYRHKELRWLTFPFILDWIWHSAQKKNRNYIPRELFRGLLDGKPEPHVLEGSQIKSARSFRRNLENIADRAASKGETLILGAYAYYIPQDYSYDAFKAQTLDYGQQIYPIELYGIPSNVKKALDTHEDIVRNLASEHHLELLDLQALLPKDSLHFDDVCHITDKACGLFGRTLEETITEN